MTQANLTNAITELDSNILDRYFLVKQDLMKKKKTQKRSWVKRASFVAACLTLLICAVPILKLMFGGSHSGTPVTNTYNSLEEVHHALGYDTLYSKLDLDKASRSVISVHTPNSDDQDEQIPLEEPLQLLIRASYPNGETTDSVNYYIIFKKDSVDDSYIGGYEEQGLTKEINGITVHYSLIQDGAMHGQAKFLYGGNLYVIDVHSWGDEYNLDTYMDMVLG